MHRPSPVRLLAAGLLTVSAVLAGGVPRGASAADAPPLRMELNRLEPREGGACRVWMLLNNPGPALDPVRLDIVLFGTDGVAARRLAVDVGPLPSGRTGARTFDVAGLACSGIGSALLNDVLACGADPAARDACAAHAELSSRVPNVRFDK